MPKHNSANEVERILALYVDSPADTYRSAEWLISNFDDEVWEVRAAYRLTIDWRVRLDDGTLLTAPRHRDTWTTFRCWLVAQTHPDSTGGRILTLETIQNILYRCLHCIDFFLLRSRSYSIARHGLSNLTDNDIRSACAQICSDSNIAISVYGWAEKVSIYLRAVMKHGNLGTCPQHVSDDPILRKEDRLLNLDESEVRKARSWLYLNAFHKRGADRHRWVINTSKLARNIYPDSIWGASTVFPMPQELCLGAKARRPREYARAPVTSNNDRRMAWRSAARYGSSLRSLRLLAAAGISGPVFDPNVIESTLKSMDLKNNLRFLSLPYTTVMMSLRQAIEYFLEHGDDVVDEYLSLCEIAQRESIPSSTAFDRLHSDVASAPREPGMPRQWSLSDMRLDHAEYFSRLRRSPGLHERISILIGAIRLTIGALTARRSSELSSLQAGTALDASRTRIVFRNRKSGIREWRQRLARPIPQLAVRMIDLLERLHAGMVTFGAAEASCRLFSTPRVKGPPGLSFSPHDCLDTFCDWAETDLDSEGRRYYIRHHQLRRFFATLFFYGDGFGGLDTLRWFLGHVDAQHVWHYITENIPGAAIRSAAADFAAYHVKHKSEEGAKLGDILLQEFGAVDFSMLDDEALTGYLHSLIDEDKIAVEPEFLDDGKRYRIAIRVSGDLT